MVDDDMLRLPDGSTNDEGVLHGRDVDPLCATTHNRSSGSV